MTRRHKKRVHEREAGIVTDADLESALLDARRGDEWAITLLFRSIQPQLLRYLSRQAPGVTEDLASETWHSAAQGLALFEGSSLRSPSDESSTTKDDKGAVSPR